MLAISADAAGFMAATSSLPAALVAAAQAGEWDTLCAQVQHATSAAELLAAVDEEGSTLLHLACKAGSTTAAEQLLALGSPASALDPHGRSALHVAVSSSAPTPLIAALLGAWPAGVSAADAQGIVPMHHAAAELNVAAMQALLDTAEQLEDAALQRSSVCAGTAASGATPLHWLASALQAQRELPDGLQECVARMAKLGAHGKLVDRSGATAEAALAAAEAGQSLLSALQSTAAQAPSPAQAAPARLVLGKSAGTARKAKPKGKRTMKVSIKRSG